MKKEQPIYRKVPVRMWNNSDFRALSAPAPNARTLWIWLQTGPETTQVPGVVVAGMPTIADRLQWPVAATRRCWSEIEERRLGFADWSAPLIWLPCLLEDNAPANPNVAKGWRTYLDNHAPPCALLERVEADIKRFLSGFAQSLQQAFDQRLRKPFQEPLSERLGETGSGTGSGDQEPPLPPSAEGGRSITRAERAWAYDELRDFRAQFPQLSYTERSQLLREGKDLPPDPPNCMHTPECQSLEHCVGRLVQAKRDDEVAGMVAERGVR